MTVKTRELHDAMFRCTEGYVQLIVDSLEFELGRSLSAEEEQAVYRHVEVLIEVSCCFDTSPVGQPERAHNMTGLGGAEVCTDHAGTGHTLRFGKPSDR
ncbi:hypothetical protein CLB51_21045 [Salmonella enterica]|nr:hypothetical protein [Salmonella enterica]EBF1559349.1 hypothetical protein [Salmonella enterica]EDU2040170.1 hypothetical protein [Salmonella enterica subsp. enterica serovar Florida]EJH6882161.1 hypothetical protein [Salmonella enterica]EKT6407571.1 hypothetical protein [Salmonella enterica]